MSEHKTVIFVSECAVHKTGALDPFFLQELPFLLSHFHRVLMVGYYGTAEWTGSKGQPVAPPPLRGSRWAVLKGGLRALFARELWQEMGRTLKAGMGRPRNVIKLFLFAARGQMLHGWLEGWLKTCDHSQTILYSYWMSYDAYACALSKEKHGTLRFLTRGHAFEIAQERNSMNPYLMKRFIADWADGLFLISENAKAQYLGYLPEYEKSPKLHVLGVGSRGAAVEHCGESPFWKAGVWRLVSCSAIEEIKQLPLLVDALAQWAGAPLHWLHLGGGGQEEALRAYAAEKLGQKGNVRFEITGWMDGEKIQGIYESQGFDVFVNTSRMEGVPVSIMEAMRFGIPVIAPKVGGIPELVDEETGILYGPQTGAQGVLFALERFTAQSQGQIQAMRQAAQNRWNERCRSERLLELLFAQAGGDRAKGGANADG